jgi:hypothetical protein
MFPLGYTEKEAVKQKSSETAAVVALGTFSELMAVVYGDDERLPEEPIQRVYISVSYTLALLSSH